MTRPSVDSINLDTARLWAKRSLCFRLQVGAVLARNGRPFATGYNNPPAGFEPCSCDEDASCKETVHAELNALLTVAGNDGSSTVGATLYLTHEPCLACSMAIVNARIARVVYGQSYGPGDGLEVLRKTDIEVEKL